MYKIIWITVAARSDYDDLIFGDLITESMIIILIWVPYFGVAELFNDQSSVEICGIFA